MNTPAPLADAPITTIDITPAGLKTADGAQRVNEALESKHDAEVEAANKLAELVKAMSYSPGKDEVIAVLNRYFGDDDTTEESMGAQLFADCEAALRKRATAHENFLRAVAGRPAMQGELRGW